MDKSNANSGTPFSERRSAVEERKRLIMEAEQSRKEAILRKNEEREFKLEAKKRSQSKILTSKNENSFAFGSSLPRSIVLDQVNLLGPMRSCANRALSDSNNNSNDLNHLEAESNQTRRPVSCIFNDEAKAESNQPGFDYTSAKPMACNGMFSEQVKACLTMNPIEWNRRSSLGNSNENLMTQSLYVMSTPNRKRHPELTPVMSKDRDFFSIRSKESNNFREANCSETKTGPKRTVSMTRLDQLAKPRQRYLEESLKLRNSGKLRKSNCDFVCMAKSMNKLTTTKSNYFENQTWESQKSRSSSMIQVFNVNSCPKASAKRFIKNSISNCTPSDYPNPLNQTISKSLVSIVKPPKDTKTSKLRAMKRASSFIDIQTSAKNGLSFSASRPISSLSGTEQSNLPITVVTRRISPRKPRPLSYAGSYSCPQTGLKGLNHSSNNNDSSLISFDDEHFPKRPNRARSTGATFRKPLDSQDGDNRIKSKPDPPRKPAHVKAAAAARKQAKKNLKESDLSESLKLVKSEIRNNQIEFTNQEKERSKDLSNSFKDLEINQKSENEMTEGSSTAKKEISTEEYKKILAEKRRQAREQSELERQRMEELKRQEEEKHRLEEEEAQRQEEERMRLEEEEQMRLAEEHRKMQEEKLKRAMEERRQKEQAEQLKREEEFKLRAEREEQEAKNRELAEKAKLEFEERLRKDEEERLLRKKKVEAIMSRTRKTPENKTVFNNSDGSRTPESSDPSPVRSIEDSKSVAFQSIYLDVCD